jgi:tryptophan synthase alpha chain
VTRVDDIFRTLRGANTAAIMPFVTGGYPTLDVTRRVLPAIQRAGASIVEVGIPFSDPIADGPVIAASMHHALAAGVTPSGVFQSIREVRRDLSIGLVAMVSISIVSRMGVDRFMRDAATAGFDGLIVPDADTSGGAAGRASMLSKTALEHGLTCSFLIAPTTTDARIETIASICTGFVYLLARVGITGERDSIPDVSDRVALVRRHTDLPVAVGFGVSSARHVAAITASADAVIVGSALVRRMGQATEPVAETESFVRDLASGLRRGAPPALAHAGRAQR